MSRDLFIKEMLPETVNMTPVGVIAKEIDAEELEQMRTVFIEKVLEISKADISQTSGYGEFNDENQLEYGSCREFLEETFSAVREGYWYHWKEMFETTILRKDFFEKYYAKMLEYAKYCEGKRYLVNNNTFFINIVTDKISMAGFPDWSRAGVTDFLLDFVIMDLNKPWLKIPELLFQYIKEHHLKIEHVHERYLCMAYFKGIDTLRWHASIDDLRACTSIMKYLEDLEERIVKIQ